jgi:hypothetical protein
MSVHTVRLVLDHNFLPDYTTSYPKRYNSGGHEVLTAKNIVTIYV